MQLQIESYRTGLPLYDVFWRLGRHGSAAFLESMPGYGDLGRFSIIGINPFLTLRGWTDHCLLNGVRLNENPLPVLERLLEQYRNEPLPGLPLSGGCIGFIAYDFGFELAGLSLPGRSAEAADRTRPLVSFDFYDNFLVEDHQQTGEIILMACGVLEPAEQSLARLRRLLQDLPEVKASDLRSWPDEPAGPTAREREEDWRMIQLPDHDKYLAEVEAIRELIRQGEVYIVNLTHQLTARTNLSAETIYGRLRRLNPAPFAALIRQGDFEIISASPECLFRIRYHDDMKTVTQSKNLQNSRDQDQRPGKTRPPARIITTRPIKGTRPRGSDAAEDAEYARQLLASGKDRAELLMIVDLERNDLSRICLPESVQVPGLFLLEKFPAVYHLVAEVQGIIRDEISAAACLRAIFPGGSITGAPKAAAMQVIDRLESQPRYLYTGCLGYFSCDGQADFNIMIRTLIKQGQDVSYGSGGGITWESAAEDEYQEMLVKARAFQQVLQEEDRRYAVD